MKNISVIGIGNRIMGDDGVGIHAIEKLRKMELPEGVEVFDAGTDAFYALESMDSREKAIVLDACKGNNIPGTIYRFTCNPRDGELKHASRLNMHEMNLMDVIIGAKGLYRLPTIYCS